MEQRELFKGNTVLLEMESIETVSPKKDWKKISSGNGEN